MARWTNATLGARGRISTTTDRRRALDGADFAVNVIQVGGHAATLLDFEIPKKYGLRQTIADTSGVGAVFRALRTIPVMLGIADDMAELCPDAWMLNYTNPMAMNCWAWYEGSLHQNVVGLCHSIQNTSRQVAEYVGVPPEEITFHGAGVNHMSWVLRVEHDGRSLYPALDAAIAADPEGLGRHVRVQVYKRFGYFPTESSEHFAEYVPWLMRRRRGDRASAHPVDEYVRAARRTSRCTRGKAHAGRRRALRDRAQRGVRGAHHPLDGHRVPRTVYGNVRNTGLITNLPQDACVEVPCLVDRAGLQPTHVGALPAQCAALDRTFLNVVELTVCAALEGDRDRVLQAVTLDPNAAAVLSLAQMETLVDEMLAAERDMMPEGLR